MKIVTVCSHIPTESYYAANAFFESCKRFGHQPMVLGSEPSTCPTNARGYYAGLGSKLRLLKKALDYQAVTDRYMIFCDAFDVVFQLDPMESCVVLEERKAVHMIFNAERKLFPFNEEVEDRHPFAETSYKYLNSGFIVGETDAFKECLRLLNADKIPDDHQRADGTWVHPNDQELWQRLFVSERFRIGMALDTRAEICQTLANVLPEELDFDEPLIRNTETNSTPIAIHINGRKEEWLPLILNHLKLEK